MVPIRANYSQDRAPLRALDDCWSVGHSGSELVIEVLDGLVTFFESVCVAGDRAVDNVGDLFIPDVIPFADEIMLGFAAAVLGMWRARRKKDEDEDPV